MTPSAISSEVDALRNELIRFLQTLVRLPSLPGEEQTAQRAFAEKLCSLGLAVEIVPSQLGDVQDHPAFCDDGVPFEDRLNVVGRWAGTATGESRPGRSLILNGHMDVVPTGEETLWSGSPWSGEVRDGKLYGRGSCDMKAGLAAAAFAVQCLMNAGYAPTGDLLVQSVIGEESGGVGTLTTLCKGFRADAAIITEPTALALCPVQSGALSFRLRVKGRAIHACMKPGGVSAIEKFYPIFQAIETLERKRHSEYQNALYPDPQNIAPINIGTLHAGDWPSTVPDVLVAEGRFGVLPGEAVDAAREALHSAIGAVVRTDEWLRQNPPVLEWFEGQFESGQTDLESPIVQTVRQCFRASVAQDARIEGVTYGSDLRLFTNHGKIPAVLFGPGSVSQAHTVDEFVEIDQVVTATKVLAYTITQWCGGSV